MTTLTGLRNTRVFTEVIMKPFLAITLGSLCIAGAAHADRQHKHCFAPKYFYRHHNEQGYTYKTHGFGIEYTLHRPEGINVKISGITNAKNKNALVETEQCLFYRLPVHENHAFYPIIGGKTSSHQIGKTDEHDYFINKSSAYGGLGWEIVPDDSFRFRIEANYFRDLHNAVMAQENDNFWGKSYSNPHGGRIKIGMSSQWKGKLFFDLDGYIARTWQKCYEEMGIEAAFKWGF